MRGKRTEDLNGASGAPRIISWNITLRCPLKCAHCYVDAGEREAEGVLSTEEAFRVIDQICETGNPVVVLSGGEPLMREDVFSIARYGTDRGLRMVMGTSGFLINEKVAAKLRESGIRAVAISLDSAEPAVHDQFRGMSGVWEQAIRAIRDCRNQGIGVQINMSVMRPDLRDVEGVIETGTVLGVREFQIFFAVPTGRARVREDPGILEYEEMIRQILIRYRDHGVNIRPTCAPQFRRIADEAGIMSPAWGRGCIAGISYCRIYANGDVTPCPYLPVSAGNVRTASFADIWYNSPLFTALRDPAMLTGKCGRCHYNAICGGCRARAYRGADAFSTGWCDGLIRPENLSDTGIFGDDPWCPYEPGGGAA
ncbi:MAG: radical SAM protein [Methanoregula sp.]|uniref:radical SAM protein n=1 Tax=Methanoregula sp. TaxID=2052170 RepID=UPI003BAFAAF3